MLSKKRFICSSNDDLKEPWLKAKRDVRVPPQAIAQKIEKFLAESDIRMNEMHGRALRAIRKLGRTEGPMVEVHQEGGKS
jgi:hypothetical protein